MKPVSLYRPILLLATVALSSLTSLALATVAPPPRHHADVIVNVEPGEPKAAKTKLQNSHHHRGHVKKDTTRDDTRDSATPTKGGSK